MFRSFFSWLWSGVKAFVSEFVKGIISVAAELGARWVTNKFSERYAEAA